MPRSPASIMVRTHVLIGLVLFSLFSTGVSEEINPNYLAEIIQFFETNYKPPGQTPEGDDLQYAVAINVPADQCRSAINQNFLSGENAEAVRQALKDNNLYRGQQLVAATPTTTERSSSRIHSERALLMCEGDQAVTPMRNLLNKDRDGCVVFYTYNSPCLEYCLNQKRDDDDQKWERAQRQKGKTNVSPAVEKCILKSLSMLTDHQGPKAFVFSQVYRNDQNKQNLRAALKTVAEKVPLYKCNSGSCVKCLDNNQIINNCLT